MRILSIDCETSPNLAWVWELYGSGLSRGITNDKLVETSQVICFSAKWVEARTEDTEPVFYSDFGCGHQQMLQAAFDLLNEADVLLHYNGIAFDEPRINRELVTYGFYPPSPYKRIDLYRVIRAKFGFPSNKLDYVCQELGVGAKAETGGFDLWKRCMAGDPDAWEQMEVYNKQDAVLNEELYRAMLPWIPNLPSYGAESGRDCCPYCGGDNLVSQGWRYSKTGRYPRYQCRDCHGWSQGTHRDSHTEVVQAVA